MQQCFFLLSHRHIVEFLYHVRWGKNNSTFRSPSIFIVWAGQLFTTSKILLPIYHAFFGSANEYILQKSCYSTMLFCWHGRYFDNSMVYDDIFFFERVIMYGHFFLFLSTIYETWKNDKYMDTSYFTTLYHIIFTLFLFFSPLFFQGTK